jgi:type IV secretion system protein VirB5
MPSAFKRAPLPFGKSTPEETPYQRAAQVWDDRIGSSRAQAANWRIACFASLGIAALTLGGYIAERSNTHVATYVIPVDTYGRPGVIELAGRAYQPSKAETAYFLSEWVTWVRSRSPTDPVVNNQNILKAYNFVDGVGRAELDDYFKASVAAAQATAGQAVTVQIKSVLQRSANTYQVDWLQTAIRQGDSPTNTHWTGVFSVIVKPPHDEASLRRNPLGVFVNSIQVSQELS